MYEYQKYLFHIREVCAYLLWLRWKLGLLFRKETKNIYKWWIVVPWTTLFYHHIPNKAMIWQIVFHIKKGMQRNGAWLRYAMRSFIQTKNGCHCPCNCLGWHTTITAATTMRRMGISLNECMIFLSFHHEIPKINRFHKNHQSSILFFIIQYEMNKW